MPRKKQIYWYFADKSETLRYDDNRKIVLGETHTVKGTPELCRRGLHASKHPLDALKYAPGNILYQVELSGKLQHQGDKSVGQKRKYLRKIDAEPILREFARWCALQVVHLWDCPPVVKEYLETGAEHLRDVASDAAGVAAWESAGVAAWESAGVAAWESASAAAWHAARAAARAAAGDAASDAATDAATDAAKAVQRQKLLAMLSDAEWIEEQHEAQGL